MDVRPILRTARRSFFSWFTGGSKNEAVTCELSCNSKICGNNIELPVIGLGTWQTPTQHVEPTLTTAIQSGYRMIDTAPVYNNEAAIGYTIEKMIQSGLIKREELFVVSKLPNYAMSPYAIRNHLYQTLQNLRINYIDLYLIHFPAGVISIEGCDLPQPDPSTSHLALWKELEEQVYIGYIKSLGLSNFNLRQIENIMRHSSVKPSNLQIEMHAYLQQSDLRDYCKARNITITAYAPLGSPGLNDFLHRRDGDCAKYNYDFPLSDPCVVEMAQKLNKWPSQILLRHLLQLGVAVIPKSSCMERIQQNMDLFSYRLNGREMSDLNGLDRGERGRFFGKNMWVGLEGHPEYPFAT